MKQRAADTSDADDKPRKLMLKKNIKRLERPSDSSQILSVSEVRTESHDEAPEVWNFYRSAPSSDLGIAPDYPANGVLLLNQMGWTDPNLPQRPVTPLQYAQSVVTPQNYTQSDYFDPFDSTQPTGFSFGGAPSIGYEIGSIGASDRAPAQDENPTPTQHWSSTVPSGAEHLKFFSPVASAPVITPQNVPQQKTGIGARRKSTITKRNQQFMSLQPNSG